MFCLLVQGGGHSSFSAEHFSQIGLGDGVFGVVLNGRPVSLFSRVFAVRVVGKDNAQIVVGGHVFGIPILRGAF